MMTSENAPGGGMPPFPVEPVDRILGPLARFLHVEAASSVVLLACVITALALANSPLAAVFLGFWETPLGFRLGSFEMVHSLRHWINDGLMAVFFFVIGLEVKRELVVGELRELRRAALPMAAAVGGMVVPAALYLALQGGGPAERGWGIPMATDIAFVVGCLAVLGPRVPRGLRVLLLSLAIVDDIGAILVVAVVYTEGLRGGLLLAGLAALGVVGLLARLGVRSTGVYVAGGVVAWLAFHESGVHATLAGVVLGLMTPARSWVSPNLIAKTVHRAAHFFRGERFGADGERRAVLRHMADAAREAVSPLERLETAIHPWVGFGIMPIFALANAGVPVRLSDLAAPTAVAVMVGLAVGKPLGVMLFGWVSVRLGLARLPDGVDWPMVLGGSALTGIGFTMALFIADLALAGPWLDVAKVGVVAGSAVSAAAGIVLLLLLARRRR